jgi:hypothetical protein
VRSAHFPNTGVVINRRVMLNIASASTHTVALASAPIPGSVQICVFRQSRTPANLTTPPAGFTLAGGAMVQAGASAFSAGLWWRATVAGDTGSLAFVGSAAVNASAMLLEVVGLTGGAPDYASHDGTTAGTTCATGTIASTAARGFAVAAVCQSGNVGTYGNAWDGSFARLFVAGPATNQFGAATRFEVPAATALNTHETWTTSRGSVGLVACFPQTA